MEVKPGYKQTEVGVIPQEWVTKRCCDLSDRITVGIVIRPAQYYVRYGIPALRSANIRESGINDADLVFISAKSNDLLAKSQTRAGDVLTVRTGYPGTSAVVRHSHAGCNCIDILITRPTGAVAPEFLARWINSPFGKEQVLRNQGGLAQKHFNVADMRNLVVALPSAPEQRAIATALGDVDALVGAQERLIAKKRDLKQAAMQRLLTGKTRLPGFSGEWGVRTLGEIAEVKTGPFGSSLHESDYVRDGTPIITVEHLGQFGVEHINLPMVSNSDRHRLRAYTLEAGDIVFSRVGSVDRNALIRRTEAGWLFSGRLLRIRPDSHKASAPYLSYYFHSEDFTASVREVAVGQTMACLNTQILKGLAVTLPPLAEQAAVTAVLTDMDAELAALEQRLAKTRALKQAMMEELLTGRTRLISPQEAHA